MTDEKLAALEKMHADVAISAVAEIFQHFPEIAKELREARAEAARWKEHLRHIAYEHCDSPVHYAMNQLED